jgi:hypothetical protein
VRVGEEKEKGEEDDVRALAGTGRKRERRERSGWCQGEAWPGVAHVGRRRKRGEGDGPRGKKGRPKREEGKGQVGLLLDWPLFSFSFPFSISFPDFQTHIHLNSTKF